MGLPRGARKCAVSVCESRYVCWCFAARSRSPESDASASASASSSRTPLHILIYSDWNKRGQERVINFFALSVVGVAPRSPLVWHCLPAGGAFGFLFRKWQQQEPQSLTRTELPELPVTTTTVRFVAVGSKFSSNYNYYDLCFGFDLVDCLRARRTHNWALFELWTRHDTQRSTLCNDFISTESTKCSRN